jgi:DNA-binding transcriptional MerR regulator
MAQAIEEEGLTIQQYNELFREEQQSGTADAEGSQFSEEQQQQFEQADARIDEIEQEAQAQIEEAITNEGLEVERFEEIWMEVRKNPELQQQVQDILQS